MAYPLADHITAVNTALTAAKALNYEPMAGLTDVLTKLFTGLNRHPLPPGTIIPYVGATGDVATMDTLTGDNLAAVTTTAGPFWLLCNGTTQAGVAVPNYQGFSPFGTGAGSVAAIGATGGSASTTATLQLVHMPDGLVTNAAASYVDNDGDDYEVASSVDDSEARPVMRVTQVKTEADGGPTAVTISLPVPPHFGVYWIKRSARIYYTA